MLLTTSWCRASSFCCIIIVVAIARHRTFLIMICTFLMQYIYSLCSVRLYKSAAASAPRSISLLTCLLSYRIKNMLQYLYLMCFINVCYAMLVENNGACILQAQDWCCTFPGLKESGMYSTAQNRDKTIMIISYCNMVDV